MKTDMDMRRLPMLFALVLSITAPAAHSDGALTVLGRDSAARPVDSLVDDLLSRFSEPAGVAGSVPQHSGQGGGSLIDGGGLPVSSALVPAAGSDTIRRIDTPMAFPICVVGPDPVSRGWLTKNRDRLHQLGAVCVLVETRGQAELDSLRKIARPVPVHPLPFDDVAARYGIRTVPVLLVGRDLR